MAERVLADELRAAAGRHVVRNIKLHKSGAEKAQIDAAILFGDIGVLFEIKTKRLTELSKQGHDESLIKDLRKGLIEAKNQLVESRAIVLGNKYDRVSSEDLHPDLEQKLKRVKHAVCVVVMAHEIPAYPLLVRTIMAQEDSTDILAVSLFDVRMMSVYLENIFDLIYYLNVRSQLGSALLYETEAALLSFHLKRRLSLPDNVDGVLVDEAYSQELDADYPSRMRGRPGLSLKFHLRALDDILGQLVDAQDPALFRTFSMLRGMSGEAAKSLNRLLIKIDAQKAADNRAHDATVAFGSSSITFVLAPGLDAARERFELLRAKRRLEGLYEEEHFLFLSSESRGRSRVTKDGSKGPRFRVRGVAARRGAGAQEGPTVFPVRIPANDWEAGTGQRT